jgi:hypothetical protein
MGLVTKFRHAVAVAVAHPGLTGLVWCLCGKRFDLWNEDALMIHIKEENDGAPQA